MLVLEAGAEARLKAAFAKLAEQRIGALIVNGDLFFLDRRDLRVALAAGHAIPMLFFEREFAVAGSLMSYGANVADAYRQAGLYIGRIVHGEKPADLPVVQPTNIELVINLKTAKALGLTVPPTLLACAGQSQTCERALSRSA